MCSRSGQSLAKQPTWQGQGLAGTPDELITMVLTTARVFVARISPSAHNAGALSWEWFRERLF
jgi:hypothetical protein